MSDRRIGVYICHCGGNISDYVDVEKVREAAGAEDGVVVAKTAMFTCSDATQQEMLQDIQEQKLDGMVVASCSPKLHLFTFRDVARRAGLNPYQYTQVNVREQCSWTHTDNREGATAKAIGLVRAGIARTNLTEPLNPIIIDTVPGVLVVGAGIAGLRAAVGLADLGMSVLLVEKSPQAGGRVGTMGKMYPHERSGLTLVKELIDEIEKRKNITLLTNAELIEKTGTIGNFEVRIRVGESGGDQKEITQKVGAIIVATGFDTYRPRDGAYGYGTGGVITLDEFKALLDEARGPLVYGGREVKNIVYIYCVGSREKPGAPSAKRYCSRYCCNAAIFASLVAAGKNPSVHQFHLFRDIRAYGKYELLYNQSREKGSLYLRFDENEPPVVEKGADGRLKVTVKDLLTYGEDVQIDADLVVLVTGMVPQKNDALNEVLKLPIGRDGFFNEIHPKLRPVETVVGGVYICGTCQGPKSSGESVASALAAVTQSLSILKKGYVELEPIIASIDQELCTWCGQCARSCPYGAIEQDRSGEREVARVNMAVCKGCGGCVPLCPNDALDLKGYTDKQIRSMIDAFLKET